MRFFLWAPDSGLPGVLVGAGEVVGCSGVLVSLVERFRACGSEGASCPAQFRGMGCQARGTGPMRPYSSSKSN